MLNILRWRSCVCQGQVKGHNETVSRFGVPGRVDGLQRTHTHPKCWVNVHEGYRMRMKGQCQGQVTKGHYKINVTNIPCETCFLGHFARRYRWQVIWPYAVTQCDFWCRSGQGQVKFLIQYFCTKSACFLLRISSGFQIYHLFFFLYDT